MIRRKLASSCPRGDRGRRASGDQTGVSGTVETKCLAAVGVMCGHHVHFYREGDVLRQTLIRSPENGLGTHDDHLRFLKHISPQRE
jgi:hypothetical protein